MTDPNFKPVGRKKTQRHYNLEQNLVKENAFPLYPYIHKCQSHVYINSYNRRSSDDNELVLIIIEFLLQIKESYFKIYFCT